MGTGLGVTVHFVFSSLKCCLIGQVGGGGGRKSVRVVTKCCQSRLNGSNGSAAGDPDYTPSSHATPSSGPGFSYQSSSKSRSGSTSESDSEFDSDSRSDSSSLNSRVSIGYLLGLGISIRTAA